MNIPWPAAALLLAGCLPGVYGQSTRGSLHISATIQASYHVEAIGEGYTSIGEGIAEGNNLSVKVSAGPVTVRAVKANSASKTYSLVVRGGKEDLIMHDLPYDVTITAVIPDLPPDAPPALYLYVIPD